MTSGDYLYICQSPNWPSWRLDRRAPGTRQSRIGTAVGAFRRCRPSLRDEASLAALTDDDVNTSETEGEHEPLSASVDAALFDLVFDGSA
jgi:hypothetical protein